MDKILLINEVITLCRLSRSAIYNGMKRGTFPQSIALTDKKIAWRASDIEKWIESRQAKR